MANPFPNLFSQTAPVSLEKIANGIDIDTVTNEEFTIRNEQRKRDGQGEEGSSYQG